MNAEEVASVAAVREPSLSEYSQIRDVVIAAAVDLARASTIHIDDAQALTLVGIGEVFSIRRELRSKSPYVAIAGELPGLAAGDVREINLVLTAGVGQIGKRAAIR